MTINHWVRSGPERWLWQVWVGDTQVIYLLQWTSPLTGVATWNVIKKVPNAAKSETTIGQHKNLDQAKTIAEIDNDKDQKKGF
jgi:hypothetical protein